MTLARPRARDFGISIGDLPTGGLNSITDVLGVKVGHTTLIEGAGRHIPGSGPIRTGVTVIFPHSGDTYMDRVVGAVEWLNGFGECLGTAAVNEFGFIIGPITLTNSFNVYRVADALQDWNIAAHPEVGIESPGLICLVAECSDDFLNDIQGRHVHQEHVFHALETARGGITSEGSVGAGTGMEVFGFKGGIGTSSRMLPTHLGGFVIGTLVLANFGIREQLIVSGIPVGKDLVSWEPQRLSRQDEGSCVIVVATDAPLSSRQLSRIARRAFLGMARTGATARNGSGDLAIAFSTTNQIPRDPRAILRDVQVVPDFQEDVINALFQATVDSAEEAILNAMFKAETMVGRNDNTVYGLPLGDVARIMEERGYRGIGYPH